MSDPQGLVYWGGVGDLISAQMTLSPGISPSTCTLVIPPQDAGKIFQAGPLVFEYGGRSWTFQRCRMDSIVDAVAANGQWTWALTILDRRCWWQECGRISGLYNSRIGDRIKKGTEEGTEKTPRDTEKTPHELAKLCLDAMNEPRYSLSGLPDAARPEMDWDYTNPAEALAQLCDKLGCMVALGLDDRVYIVRKNRGEPLPSLNPIEGSAMLDPPDPPGKVVIVCGRTRYQRDFELEAVGLDVDGSIRPIDELSYTPLVGGVQTWKGYADLVGFTGLPREGCSSYAQRSVYRWYRVKVPFWLPGTTGQSAQVESLDRILPLENEQIETWEYEGKMQARPYWVYGEFDEGRTSGEPLVSPAEPKIDNKPEGLYQKGHSLDVERGIVKFGEQVYITEGLEGLRPRLDAAVAVPAKIHIRVAVNLRDKETGGWEREEVERSPPVSSPAPGLKQYILHEDVVREVYERHGPGPMTVVNNIKEVKKQADHYLDAAMIVYQPKHSASISYPGLLPIVPDGAIHQVTWVVAGNGQATTRASRNREESAIAETYDEKRQRERLKKELRENAKPERQRAVDAKKRKAPQ